jgi:hypothetical protein
MSHECPHCGATFTGAYFRNRHGVDCDPDEQTDTDTHGLDPDETERELIEIPERY